MPLSPETYVLPGLRSPFCKMDGQLATLDALHLSVPVVQQTVVGATGPGPDRAAAIDLILWGSVIPTLTVSNWGREVWLDSGLDPRVPAQTVVQACGTSLAAATQAAARIRTGGAELVLCGGVESASNTQIGLSRGLSRTIRRSASAGSVRRSMRTIGGLRPADIRISVPAARERTTGMTMGQHAEVTAREWKIPRDDQDRLALASHQRAVARRGAFFRPLLVTPGTFPVDGDTIPRADTSLDRLASLRPAFDRERGTLTAGNSSPLTDGAAACWVAGPEGVRQLPDALPRARLLDWEEAAVDPERDGLLMAPAIAIPRLLQRHGLGYEDVDLWEIHEAFAAQVLSTVAALVNPNGGSLALGHPFAATGARLLSQATRELADRPAGTRAVVSICAAGGLGQVALLESV